MDVEERIKELGIELSEASAPKGNYIGAKWAGNIAFSCGQGPFESTKWGMVGKVHTVESGYQAARETGLNCLAQLKKRLGSMNRIKQVLQVIGFINSAEGFLDQPAVLNGFTDLLVSIWGNPQGKPARAAIPVHHPGWIPIEAWMVVELEK